MKLYWSPVDVSMESPESIFTCSTTWWSDEMTNPCLPWRDNIRWITPMIGFSTGLQSILVKTIASFRFNAITMPKCSNIMLDVTDEGFFADDMQNKHNPGDREIIPCNVDFRYLNESCRISKCMTDSSVCLNRLPHRVSCGFVGSRCYLQWRKSHASHEQCEIS